MILAGILAAFGIEAWWAYRNDRAEEATRLQAAYAELLDSRAGFESHLAYLDRQDRLGATILAHATNPPASWTTLDTLLFQLGPFNEYVPPTAAFGDAVSAGGVALIQSAEIRLALADYGSALERDIREPLRIRDDFATQMSPLWYEYVNLRGVMIGDFEPADYPEVPFESRYEDLFQDPRFANQIVQRSLLVARVRRQHRGMLERIDTLLLLLGE